jgi:WD40 repeat protein
LGFYETYPQRSLLLAVEGGRIVSSKNEREPISLRSFLFKAFRDVSGVGLGGHQAAVRSLSFSSNGEWLASVSVDKRTLLWNISAPEGEISSIKLPGHGNEIRSLPLAKRLKHCLPVSWTAPFLPGIYHHQIPANTRPFYWT